MSTCYHCKKDLKGGEKTCPYCGKDLRATYNCPWCSHNIRYETLICPGCNNHIVWRRSIFKLISKILFLFMLSFDGFFIETKNPYKPQDAQRKGKMESKLAKNIAIGIPTLILTYILYVFFGNIFNFSIISDYGFYQYGANIIHIQDKSYVELVKDYSLYSDADISENVLLSLKQGQKVRSDGHRVIDGKTWVAVSVFKDGNPVYGYILIDGEVEYDAFEINPVPEYFKESSIKIAEDQILKEYIKEVDKLIKAGSYKVKYAKDEKEKNKITEKLDFKNNYSEVNSKFLTEKDVYFAYCDNSCAESIEKNFENKIRQAERLLIKYDE